MNPMLSLFLVLPGIATAEVEPRFDHDRFCAAAQEVGKQANAQRGSWLDEYTRHEGMKVDCEGRAVELSIYVPIPFKDIPGNWQDRVHQQWSNEACNDAAWAASIEQRWKVILSVRSVSSEQFSARADCH